MKQFWMPCLAGLALVAGCLTHQQTGSSTPPEAGNWPGSRPDGTVRLPNQWLLDPVGKQVSLGDFPVNMAVDPSGRFAAVLHSGFGPHEIILVDVPSAKILSRTVLPEAFHGIAFTPDGKRIVASGAGKEVIHLFDFQKGSLANGNTVALRPASERGIPAGIAVSPDGRKLWVANVLGQSVTEVALQGATNAGTVVRDIQLGERMAPPVAGEKDPWLDLDEESITKRARALLEVLNTEAPYPFACLPDVAHDRLYVSHWGRAEVGVLELSSGRKLARWAVQEHPNEMVLNRAGNFLFVANANRNTISVLETAGGSCVETLASELEPDSPPGSTPNSVALSPDESLLFVSNANINAIAVFDVRQPGRSR